MTGKIATSAALVLAAGLVVAEPVPRGVPPLMRTFAGNEVKTLDDWQARRAELKEKFFTEMYGKRPEGVDRPSVLRFEKVEPDKEMMDGKAVRKVSASYFWPRP